MTDSGKRKKKAEETLEEKIDKRFFKEVGVVQEELDAVENAISTCSELLHYYLDNLPPKQSVQKSIISLLLDCDHASLSKTSLDLALSRLLKQVKQEVMLKESQKVDQREAEQVRQQLDKLRLEVQQLVQNTRRIVEKIQEEGY